MTLSLLAESFVEVPRTVLGEQGYKAIRLDVIALEGCLVDEYSG